MRILSGQYKGKKLYAGKDFSIRPTTNKIKEIIFSILGDFYIDKNVLDLFCGSGSLGIEALSRGAASITFVENSQSAIKILESNISHLELDKSKIFISKIDVLKFILGKKRNFNLILADPPFKYSSLQILIDTIISSKILHRHGILLVHHERTNSIQSPASCYEIIKQKGVGRSLITFIINRDENAEDCHISRYF